MKINLYCVALNVSLVPKLDECFEISLKKENFSKRIATKTCCTIKNKTSSMMIMSWCFFIYDTSRNKKNTQNNLLINECVQYFASHELIFNKTQQSISSNLLIYQQGSELLMSKAINREHFHDCRVIKHFSDNKRPLCNQYQVIERLISFYITNKKKICFITSIVKGIWKQPKMHQFKIQMK